MIINNKQKVPASDPSVQVLMFQQAYKVVEETKDSKEQNVS